MLPLLTLLACGDLVETDVLDAELGNRDIQIETLDARIAELEVTVTSQAALIESQAAALAALEVTVNDGDATLAARVDALDAAFGATSADVDARFTTLESVAETLQSDLGTLDGSVSSVTSSVALLDTALVALEDEVDAEAVWSDEGSGAGSCARVNVTATSDRPLYVFATVEASASGGGGCSTIPSATTTCDLGSSVPMYETSTSGTVTVDAQSVRGPWDDSVSVEAGLESTFAPYAYYSGGAASYYGNGYHSISHSWTIPVQAVLEIPSAGDYTVDLDVTGLSGDCRLVVLQP